ncbi:MAG: hypothetical protein ACFB15_07620 [Cyclobacteriaceae bacterium]
MRNHALILLLLFSVLTLSCQEDEGTEPSEETSTDELQPVANNGLMEATIDGEPFSTSLISSSVAINTENPEIDIVTVAGVAFEAGDTTIVGVQLYGDYETLEVNTTYTSSATGIYPAVVGIYSPEPTTQQTAGFGTGELVFTELDKSARKISGTFQISGDIINLGSPSNPSNTTFSIEGSFQDVTFEMVNP